VNPIEQIIAHLQNLASHVPEQVQPLIVMAAGAIPFVEAEGATLIGAAAGVNLIVAAIAAAAGNFLSVLAVVTLSSRARRGVLSNRAARRSAVAAAAGGVATLEAPVVKPESKGRARFNRWVLRFGVPGASILGPLAIPTQITSSILIAGGTPRAWVLLWQGVAIIVWTTVTAVSVWLALQLLASA